MIAGAVLIITISSFFIGFAVGTLELLQTVKKSGENMIRQEGRVKNDDIGICN